MMGYTDARAMPSAERFAQLTSADGAGPLDAGQPLSLLPGPSARPAAHPPSRRGWPPPDEWLVEWKYDGIRAQVVKRNGQAWIWSRGEELVTERFPEIVAGDRGAPPTAHVLDGEIVVMKDAKGGAVQPAAAAHRPQEPDEEGARRCARPPSSPTTCSSSAGADLRERPQRERRALLEATVAAHSAIHLSPVETRASWHELAELRHESRSRGVEGFMLKHRDARYGTGRRKQADIAAGTWWKWKIDPLTVDCVLIYAQAGHGRARERVHRLHLRGLEPHAGKPSRGRCGDRSHRRAQAGRVRCLAARRFRQGIFGPHATKSSARSTRAIRKTTLEKFGPVRSVRPTLVFRAGLRGHQPQHAAQERHRRALPAHAAHPPRQAAARSRHHAVAGSAAGAAPRRSGSRAA